MEKMCSSKSNRAKTNWENKKKKNSIRFYTKHTCHGLNRVDSVEYLRVTVVYKALDDSSIFFVSCDNWSKQIIKTYSRGYRQLFAKIVQVYCVFILFSETLLINTFFVFHVTYERRDKINSIYKGVTPE